MEPPQISGASAFRAGLTLRCPACGKGKLFSGYLRIVDRCPACGTDLHNADTGDGPSVFVILVVGFLVVGAALFTEMTFHPPYWVHATLWLPTILVLSLLLLPLFKSLFFASHFHNKAGEGIPGPE